MSRSKALIAAGLGGLVCLTAAAPAASAQPPPQASCVGVLSSFAGQAGIRNQFAPAPGAQVARVAQEHGDFGFCLTVLFTP